MGAQNFNSAPKSPTKNVRFSSPVTQLTGYGNSLKSALSFLTFELEQCGLRSPVLGGS